MQTTSDCGSLPMVSLTPGPKAPSCGGDTTGIPAYKARRKGGGLSVAIRFDLSAADLAALLYANCLQEDTLSDRDILEQAVVALAVPADIAVYEAGQQVLRERGTQSGIADLDAAECAAARKFLAYCELRASEIIQGH